MGELGGFLKIERVGVPYEDPTERDHRASTPTRSSSSSAPTRSWPRRARAAWTAACPSATTAARWATSSPTGTTSSTATAGRTPSASCTPPTTSPSSPAACARRRARPRACWRSARATRSRSSRSRTRSSTTPGTPGWVVPVPPRRETGRSVAVVGAGPAGMAAAQQLRRAGHRVVLYERDEAAGGLVRFGVPDFKIEKTVVERRVQQLVAEGVELRLGVDVGVDVSAEELREQFDAVVLAIGSRVPRDLPVPGRELDGVHFAMDYLYVRNRWVAGSDETSDQRQGQERHRHRRRRHRRRLRGQLDPRGRRLGRPARAAARAAGLAPRRAHAVAAVAAEVPPQLRDGGGEGGGPRRAGLLGRHHRAHRQRARAEAALRPGAAGAALRARSRAPRACSTPTSCCWRWASCIPEHDGAVDQLQVEKDPRGNVRAPTYATSVEGVFAAGDARRGQSLIVWAINEGRQCARMVDRYLCGLDREPVVVGGGDADEGPEGPPQVAGPVLAAPRPLELGMPRACGRGERSCWRR